MQQGKFIQNFTRIQYIQYLWITWLKLASKTRKHCELVWSCHRAGDGRKQDKTEITNFGVHFRRKEQIKTIFCNVFVTTTFGGNNFQKNYTSTTFWNPWSMWKLAEPIFGSNFWKWLSRRNHQHHLPAQSVGSQERKWCGTAISSSIGANVARFLLPWKIHADHRRMKLSRHSDLLCPFFFSLVPLLVGKRILLL